MEAQNKPIIDTLETIVNKKNYAYSFEWPYVSLVAMKPNIVILLNAFDPVMIHRIEMKAIEESVETKTH